MSLYRKESPPPPILRTCKPVSYLCIKMINVLLLSSYIRRNYELVDSKPVPFITNFDLFIIV